MSFQNAVAVGTNIFRMNVTDSDGGNRTNHISSLRPKDIIVINWAATNQCQFLQVTAKPTIATGVAQINVSLAAVTIGADYSACVVEFIETGLWDIAWGRVYFNMLTSGDIVLATNNETTTADLGAQSFLGGRNYVITGEITMAQSVIARALARIYNVTDGVRKSIQDGPLAQINLRQTRQASINFSPTITVSKQFRVTFQNAAANGNLTCAGDVNDGAWIAAYDVGPSAPP
jgi:hypothetical protein